MTLRVILIDDEPGRAAEVSAALTAEGFAVVGQFPTGAGLQRQVAELQADIIVVDIESPDRAPETIRAAIEAGVSAYVVDGLKPERVKPVVDVAIARFAQFQELRSELDKAKSTLAERKLVERAKGILMKRRRCDEEEAYRLMRKMAMDQKSRLVDIANKIIEAAELLG